MHVVLLEPEIPPNTGNIARLCAGLDATLHLVEPLGFDLDNRQLQRAGMDYWRHVRWHRWRNWEEFRTSRPADARFWFIEQGAPQPYHQAAFARDDHLVFGRESAGLPRGLLEADPAHWIDLPMLNPEARSLNVANCVAVVLFEALRQTGFTRPS